MKVNSATTGKGGKRRKGLKGDFRSGSETARAVIEFVTELVKYSKLVVLPLSLGAFIKDVHTDSTLRGKGGRGGGSTGPEIITCYGLRETE